MARGGHGIAQLPLCIGAGKDAGTQGLCHRTIPTVAGLRDVCLELRGDLIGVREDLGCGARHQERNLLRAGMAWTLTI